MTDEKIEENARIVAFLARFYDCLVDKRELVDGHGRPLSDGEITKVLAEAGLAEEHKVAPLLGEIKARVANGADPELIRHRDWMLQAEYAERHEGVPASGRAEAASFLRQYADHYLIGLERARSLCVGPRVTTGYATPAQLEAIEKSLHKQMTTLGVQGFAQPLVAESRITQLALARRRAEMDAAHERQTAAHQHEEAAAWRQQAEAVRRQQAETDRRQLAEMARRQQVSANYQQVPAHHQQVAAAYPHAHAAYRPGGSYPGNSVFAATARPAAPPPRPAAPHPTMSHYPSAYAHPVAHIPTTVRAPQPTAPYGVPYGVPWGSAYGTQQVPAPDQGHGPKSAR
ncbi:hypothetical protein ABZX30_19250 [Streptomyces sp. NPDC004542]|uniref:hypothetical protein n=1 Tax=Streptomyces sp. NPDC004542 TaxID=3154281 RepID=UPI0033AE3441